MKLMHQDPFTPSKLYNYMAENHNVTLLGSEESVIKDLVLTDIEAIKQQAEKMGYELVLVKKWESKYNKFQIEDGDCFITDKADEERVRLTLEEMQTLIEKYNQFHAAPTT